MSKTFWGMGRGLVLGAAGMFFWGFGGQSGFASENVAFEQVKPILEAKCASCHAAEGQRPLSAKIPIWNYATSTHTGLAQKKYAIDALLAQGAEASEGHLKMLEYTLRKNSMPPIQYRLLRPGKRLSQEERTQILDWIYSIKPQWKEATA